MKSETSETVLVVPSSQTTPLYVSYPQRFYVLFVFSFFAFNQSMIWLTFSPIARSAEAYYKISDATDDLLLNWGPIIFIPCLPLTYILLNKHHGLRRCIIILAITDFVAALVRVIPIVITSPSSPHFSTISLPFIHFGQILNAACGPLVIAPVSQLSCLWFAPHERTRATTVAIFSAYLGSSIGFVISPAIVSSPDNIPYLLYVHLALAFIACVLALLYFPAEPPSAPSAAAELLILQSITEQSNNTWRTFMKHSWQCFTTPAFVLISTVAGLLYGVLSSWTSLYDIILEPENYTEQQAGE
jgi:FLVCR family MFS transporter